MIEPRRASREQGEGRRGIDACLVGETGENMDGSGISGGLREGRTSKVEEQGWNGCG